MPPITLPRNTGLNLPGWDDYSVWGWDDREGSLFAQLWRNDDDSGARPRIWISPVMGWPIMKDPAALAEAIATATGCSPDAVADAILESLGLSSH